MRPNSDDEVVIDPVQIRENISASTPDEQNDPLLDQALEATREYDRQSEQGSASASALPQEVKEKMNMFRMQSQFAERAAALRLPQFVRTQKLPLFIKENPPLTSDDLLAGFTLRDKDTVIDFSAIDAEIAQVDVADSDETPKALKLSGFENQWMREWFGSSSPKERIARSKKIIKDRLSRIDALDDCEITDYISRWIADYFLTWQFGTGKQALSIPPSPQELWAAFHGTLTGYEYRKDDGLFFPGDDEYPGLNDETFVIKFSEATRQG